MFLGRLLRRAAAIALVAAGPVAHGLAMPAPGDPVARQAVSIPATPGLRVPVHDTHGSSVEEAEAATEVARHIVEDLIAERKIDRDWGAAAVADAKRVRPSIKSPFHMWIVRFEAARAVAEHGTELFVFVSETGAFLKYNYDGK